MADVYFSSFVQGMYFSYAPEETFTRETYTMSVQRFFIFGVFVLSSCLICYADQPQTKQNKEQITEVTRILKQLAKPSQMARQMKSKKFNVKPYYKIVDNGDGKSTLIYRCRFTQANSLLNAVESMVSAEGLVEESTEQNLIVVNDLTSKMESLKNALLAMDISSPQILVEAKVVEVMISDGVQRDLSVIWNQQTSGLDSTAGTVSSVPNQSSGDAGHGANVNFFPVVSDGGGSNLNVALEWLQKAEDAKVLSAPNVIVSRNASASIVTGTDLPIQSIQVTSGSTSTSTEFKRIGVILKVTPSLINDDYVTLKVNPQVSTVQSYDTIVQNDSEYSVPVISIRNIETELTLKDGQVIMLGGLYTSKDISASDETPILSDLPWIGDLFTGKSVSKEVTQLIFFLKISILTQEELGDGMIYDPGKQADTLRKMGNAVQKSQNIFPKRVDTFDDTIKGAMRYKDAEGNIDIVGGNGMRTPASPQSPQKNDSKLKEKAVIIDSTSTPDNAKSKNGDVE